MHPLFNDPSLPEAIQKALRAMNFEKPTPIQLQAIPAATQRKDMIGLAQTGTGKTAAFCIPTLVRLLAEPDLNALILAPTRELAQQIEGVWKDLTRFSKEVRSVVLVGGAAMQPQIRALAHRPRLLISTPGRLIDHLNRKSANLSQTGILILDEADRMLDMGFAPQLSQILRYVPQNRQTLLFSATWNSTMDDLARRYLQSPIRISVAANSQAAQTITQSMVSTTAQGKNNALLDELNQREGSVLVFARTKSRTDRVAKYLASYGVEVSRIHGGRTQGQRNSALSAFRDGRARVLVATDIAARGIDVARIAHVINYDLPDVPEDYVHRIGRTGRAGASGSAVSLVTPEEHSQWKDIERLLKKGGSALPQLHRAMRAF
jgi:ATP-dependent RNA helicase DeaD